MSIESLDEAKKRESPQETEARITQEDDALLHDIEELKESGKITDEGADAMIELMGKKHDIERATGVPFSSLEAFEEFDVLALNEDAHFLPDVEKKFKQGKKYIFEDHEWVFMGIDPDDGEWEFRREGEGGGIESHSANAAELATLFSVAAASLTGEKPASQKDPGEEIEVVMEKNPTQYKSRRITQVLEGPTDDAIRILRSLARDAKTEEERNEAATALTELGVSLEREVKEKVLGSTKEDRGSKEKEHNTLFFKLKTAVEHNDGVSDQMVTKLLDEKYGTEANAWAREELARRKEAHAVQTTSTQNRKEALHEQELNRKNLRDQRSNWENEGGAILGVRPPAIPKEKVGGKLESKKFSPLELRILNALNNKQGDTVPRETLEKNKHLPEVAEYLLKHLATKTEAESLQIPSVSRLSNRVIADAIEAAIDASKYPTAETPFEIKQGRKQNMRGGKENVPPLLPTQEIPISKERGGDSNDTDALARMEGEGGGMGWLGSKGGVEEYQPAVFHRNREIPRLVDEATPQEKIVVARIRVEKAKIKYGGQSEEYKDAARDLRVFEIAAMAGSTETEEGIIIDENEIVPSPKTGEEHTEVLALKEQLAKMTPGEREDAGWNLQNFGFQFEKIKNNIYSGTYGFVATHFEKNTTTGRFFTALKEQFEEKNAAVDEQMKRVEAKKKTGKGTGWFSQLSNVGYFTGNILKYGRIVSDIGGWTVMAPLRGVMIGSTMAASGLDAAKDARLENEEVKEKTRIADIEKAANEAWGVYARAMQKHGLDPEKDENTKVTAEELKKAYQEEIPKDLLARLTQNPDWFIHGADGPGLVQKVFETHITWAAKRMQGKLEKIDANAALSPAEKNKQKEALLVRFGRSKMLQDFDRMVSQEGLVDTLAMSSRYGSQAAKAVVYGMMAQSAYQLWDHFSEAFAVGSSKIPYADAPPDSANPEAFNAANFNKNIPEVVGRVLSVEELSALRSTGGVDNPVQANMDLHNKLIAAMGASKTPLSHEEIQSILGVKAALPPPETVASSYVVASGDNFTRILKANIPELKALSPLAQENVIQNFIHSLSLEEMKTIGITDVNKIQIGQNIHLDMLNEILLHKNVGGENIITHAQHLEGNAINPNSATLASSAEISAPVASRGIQGAWESLSVPERLAQVEGMAQRHIEEDIGKLFGKGPLEVWPKEWFSLRERDATDLLLQKDLPSTTENLPGYESDAVSKIQRYVQEQGLTTEKGFIPQKGETLSVFLLRVLKEKIMRDGQFSVR